MTVFHTNSHDMSLVSSPTKSMSSDEIAANLYAAAMSDTNTDAEHEFHYVDCDSWVDDMMMGILEDIQY